MKYIKDIKAILLEIGMAFSVHGYMKSTGFFCLPQRKKETRKKGKKKTGKERKTKEINRFFLPATKKKRNTEKGKKENWKRKKNKGNLVGEKKSE